MSDDLPTPDPNILSQPIPLSLINAREQFGACKEGLLTACKAHTWSDLAPEYLGWAAVYAPDLTLPERLALCNAGDDPAWRRGAMAAHTLGLTLPQRLSLCNTSDNPAYWYREMSFHYGTTPKGNTP